MNSFENIEKEVREMLDNVSDMLDLVMEAFRKNSVESAEKILEREDNVNQTAEKLTRLLVEAGKEKKEAEDKISFLVTNVGYIERIGDYCAELSERIKRKISGNILFSDKANSEFSTLYDCVSDIMKKTVVVFNEKDKSIANEVLEKGKETRRLINDFGTEHEARLIKGICPIKASTIYLDMLDFMRGIVRYSEKIVSTC